MLMAYYAAFLELQTLIANSLGALHSVSNGIALRQFVTHVLVVLLHHVLSLVVINSRVSLLRDCLFLFNRL